MYYYLFVLVSYTSATIYNKTNKKGQLCAISSPNIETNKFINEVLAQNTVCP